LISTRNSFLHSGEDIPRNVGGVCRILDANNIDIDTGCNIGDARDGIRRK
jgi:hypothetical protein